MRALRRTELRAVAPDDMEPLYAWLTESDVADRWRYHGRRPAFDEFVNDLWFGVHEQDLIISRESGERIGLVSAYNADMRSGTCYVALVSAPSYTGSGLAVEGMVLFTANLFREWPFRKVHFEVYGYNDELVRGLAKRTTLEARLIDDLRWQDAFHDRYIFTADRDQWLDSYWPTLARFA